MKTKHVSAAVVLLALLVSLVPAGSAVALAPIVVPPVDMFQLPWEQGASWVAYDGFDNGFKRLLSSPHDYVNGGAVDFAPHPNMQVGEDTSNFWVTAAAAGTVVQTSSCSLMIEHGNGWLTDYQFLAHMQVKLGDVVFRNERLGVIADGLREPFCPPALEPDVPHLHFALRPNMRNATIGGWLISYIPLLNQTTFTRNGQSVGSFQPLLNSPGSQVALREPLTFDTRVNGSVDSTRAERWPFTLTETTSFTITATPSTSGLVPLLVLLDANGNELARGTGTLTSTQPAGSYFVQVQAQAGAGFYALVLHKNAAPQPTGPNVSTSITPASVAIGESAQVTVHLGDVPAGGYTSTEFTCTYNGSLAEASGMAAAGLFGTDPVVAINGPQNGSFIFAIAGSDGRKATTDGSAFTFSLKGLQGGQTTVECKARVSTGNNTLTAIQSSAAALNIGNVPPTPTSSGPATPLPGTAATETAAPAVPQSSTSPTPSALPATSQAAPSPTPSPFPTATATSTPPPVSTLSGQVHASKPVTVSLLTPDNTLVTSVAANGDGSFSLTAPAGTYTVVASAAGFLKAQGTVTLSDGQASTMPTVSLLAGDIDGNNVIDQFDALTIGMGYNTDTPAAADLNNDGVINVLDLELLAHNYRLSGALAWK